MTREEALSLLNKHKDDDVADVKVIKDFINIIFDYFEPKMEELAELHKIACELQKSRDKAYAYLEELENRSCESCKYGKQIDGEGFENSISCTHEDCPYSYNSTEKDDICKYFEIKV